MFLEPKEFIIIKNESFLSEGINEFVKKYGRLPTKLTFGKNSYNNFQELLNTFPSIVNEITQENSGLLPMICGIDLIVTQYIESGVIIE